MPVLNNGCRADGLDGFEDDPYRMNISLRYWRVCLCPLHTIAYWQTSIALVRARLRAALLDRHFAVVDSLLITGLVPQPLLQRFRVCLLRQTLCSGCVRRCLFFAGI